MSIVIPDEVRCVLWPNEEVRYSFTGSKVGYYFTDERIFIEMNEAMEQASKTGSLFSLAMGIIAKPKRFTCIPFDQIEAPELVNFGLNLRLLSGRVEALRFRNHNDACAMYKHIHDNLIRKKSEGTTVNNYTTTVNNPSGPVAVGENAQAFSVMTNPVLPQTITEVDLNELVALLDKYLKGKGGKELGYEDGTALSNEIAESQKKEKARSTRWKRLRQYLSENWDKIVIPAVSFAIQNGGKITGWISDLVQKG